jgi:hypothetical protein
MKKSNFCSEHFAMNCKLCDGDPEPISPADVKSLQAPLVAGPTVGLLPSAFGAAEQIAPALPVATGESLVTTFRSEESEAVLSVTVEYAKACDEYTEAIEAVANMVAHISRLKELEISLQANVVGKKTRKEELRKKVLETLGE